MRIVFLLPVRTQVRFRKRIGGLLREGIDCAALYFRRDYYPGRSLPCAEICLGSMEHGKYMSRIPSLIRAVPEVRRRASNAQVLYAFGLDQALLAIGVRNLMKGGGPLVVYEVGDVRELLLRESIFGWFARMMDRWAVETVDLLIATSRGFVEGYHGGILHAEPDPYMVIENKVDPVTFPAPQRAGEVVEGARIVIGSFGVLRCSSSWATLRRIAILRPDGFRVLLAGITKGLKGLEETVRHQENIDYHGPYMAPEELADLYGQVDLVWGAHYRGEQIGDWKWARANRFYEACFYGVPLIAQKETLDAEVVEEYEVGVVVDLRDPTAAAEQITGIGRSEINRWRRNMQEIPSSIYQYGEEHRALTRRLRNISTV